MKWQIASFVAMFSYGSATLSLVWGMRMGVNPFAFNILACIFLGILVLIVKAVFGISLFEIFSSGKQVISVFTTAFFWCVGGFAVSLAMQDIGIKNGNPGNVSAIMTTCSVPVVLGSIILFSAPLELKKLLIGIPLVIAGIVVIVR